VSVPASARPSRSYPWWGWLSIAVAGVLVVGLVLRLRGRRLAP
jgi:hypothetical protein